MKNEKLESLLNKVVEYDQPGKVNFKGFLYKDRRGYYIKVVEHIYGTDVAVNDILYLKDGEEQYIVVAEKPKLMRVSLKSWHYRLVKFVLGDNAPTPRTMQNGCPYFWLLVFSIFACPFVALFNGIALLFIDIIPGILLWILGKLTLNWINDVDDATAFEISIYGRWSDYVKMPVTAKLYLDKSGDDFLSYYMEQKYALTRETDPVLYKQKSEELKAKWEEWRLKVYAEREKRDAEASERKKKEYQRRSEYQRIRAIKQAKWEARMKPIKAAFNRLYEGITDLFTFDLNWKNIIKRTKQVMGVIVTLVVLAGTFFVVGILSFLLMGLIDLTITYWYVPVIILGLCAAGAILYFTWILFSGWLQNVVNKYNGGRKVWYLEPIRLFAVYIVYYPMKYIVYTIAYGLFYILFVPVKFIFYDIIYKLILEKIGKLIWRGIRGLGRGLASSTGIFGEYFSASYTDYCPGIEWTDVPEEE